jgi:hypothetical protein
MILQSADLSFVPLSINTGRMAEGAIKEGTAFNVVIAGHLCDVFLFPAGAQGFNEVRAGRQTPSP